MFSDDISNPEENLNFLLKIYFRTFLGGRNFSQKFHMQVDVNQDSTFIAVQQGHSCIPHRVKHSKKYPWHVLEWNVERKIKTNFLLSKSIFELFFDDRIFWSKCSKSIVCWDSTLLGSQKVSLYILGTWNIRENMWTMFPNDISNEN